MSIIPGLDRITLEQKAILNAPANISMCINAAPGAGKTSTIVMRIVILHRAYQIPLNRICLVTYNKFLADEMTQKLNAYGIPAKDMGWCGTIHAFCYRETQKMSDLRPWISQHSADEIVYPYLQYIFFDEYQDADPDIFGVLEILSRQKVLTIVGDERQQIYAYKGADSNLLRSLRTDFVYFPLSQSFRCNKKICRLLSRLYPSYPEIRSENLGVKPKLYRSRGRYMNNDKIIEQIVKIVTDLKGGSVAIVSPIVHTSATSKFLNDIHSNLEKRCQCKFDCLLGDLREYDFSKKPSSENIITSIHGVKGKEYDCVILLNVVDNAFLYDCPTAEALSKLFVGLSRARHGLHIFEHLYHKDVGSIKWIVENEDCFIHVPNWIGNPRERIETESSFSLFKSVVEYIRGCNQQQKDDLVKDYSSEELVREEIGLFKHYGSPELSGQLIEYLLAIQYLKVKPKIYFDIYITRKEWTELSKGKSLSFERNVHQIFPECDIPKIEKGVIILRTSQGIITITEKDIVSNLIYQEYYRYLPQAIELSKQITDVIDIPNVQLIWWILRFQRLAQLSLTGFNQPDLTIEDIQYIIEYITSSTALNSLELKVHHSLVHGYLPMGNQNLPVMVSGEIDFCGEDNVLEVKCYVSRSLEEAWLQVMTYNKLLELKGVGVKKIYVYNAISGELWCRVRK